MGKILVIGSSNTDLITLVKNFPAAGETIQGISFLQVMGGKGANQAFAAHKLGGDVKFITCLGKDANGENTLEYYKEQGLDVSSSLIIDGVPSGIAIILVDERGENCIVVTPGSNNLLSPEYIYAVEKDIAEADIVLLQMEIPYNAVKTVCEIAHKYNKRIMLNVAPARQLDEDILKKIDILVVNETEAETISGQKIKATGEETIVDSLLAMGPGAVILTLGKNGCLLKTNKTKHYVPAFIVDAVDCTAAGDTFCGALAAELSNSSEWEKALQFATAASAICVTRLGAQPSIPAENEVRKFLNLELIESNRK